MTSWLIGQNLPSVPKVCHFYFPASTSMHHCRKESVLFPSWIHKWQSIIGLSNDFQWESQKITFQVQQLEHIVTNEIRVTLNALSCLDQYTAPNSKNAGPQIPTPNPKKAIYQWHTQNGPTVKQFMTKSCSKFSFLELVHSLWELANHPT